MSQTRSGGRTKNAPARAAQAKAKPRPAKKSKSTNSSADAAFKKISAIALALPDTKLTMTWGSPHFRVGEKIFCGFGTEDGKQVLGVKLEMLHAKSVVKEARFWPSPYVGKHGWVSTDVALRKSWDEMAALIRESYGLIASKASLAKLR
ncbi:MAG TPA: MmcQ/YjbR family DNA-binding protein [Polyangiaceae bacterium]|nr:MmcQ/YjbR family DNA-binding protein [Polyangiaceae bacterium]